MGVGVGEGGIWIDEERDPMLMGVAGFLEVPTEMGVETLTVMIFGIARWGVIEGGRVRRSSTSCCSEAREEVDVSNRCGMEEGGCIEFGVSLEYAGAELEGPGFDGESEVCRRCLTTGRNSVPPFSTRTQLNTP